MKMVVVVEFDVAEDRVEPLLREVMDYIRPGLQGPALRGFHVAIKESADAVLAAMQHTHTAREVTMSPEPEPDVPEDDNPDD